MQAYNLLKLVQRHGSTLILKKTTAGSYNASTGEFSSTVKEYEITAYMYNVQEGVLLNEIRRGTRNCVIPALGLPAIPTDNDQISGRGDTVSINNVQTIYASGVAVCYVCEVSE